VPLTVVALCMSDSLVNQLLYMVEPTNGIMEPGGGLNTSLITSHWPIGLFVHVVPGSYQSVLTSTGIRPPFSQPRKWQSCK